MSSVLVKLGSLVLLITAMHRPRRSRQETKDSAVLLDTPRCRSIRRLHPRIAKALTHNEHKQNKRRDMQLKDMMKSELDVFEVFEWRDDMTSTTHKQTNLPRGSETSMRSVCSGPITATVRILLFEGAVSSMRSSLTWGGSTFTLSFFLGSGARMFPIFPLNTFTYMAKRKKTLLGDLSWSRGSDQKQ